MTNWRKRARRLKDQIRVIYLAFRDRRTPWYLKVLIAIVIAYALSPIDLIPDFIPVLGYLDDLIIIPVGIYLVLKMMPDEILEDCQQKVRAASVSGSYL